ncbi:hypothetical protein ACFE04_022531 [Oxalis oulophora]
MFTNLPSGSMIMSYYASISAVIMLLRTIPKEIKHLLPKSLQRYIITKFSHLFSSNFTFIIEDQWEATNNGLFRAVEAYLPTRIGPTVNSLMMGSEARATTAKRAIPVDTEVIDVFQGIEVTWILHKKENKNRYSWITHKKHFELWCNKNSWGILEQNYLPYIMKTGREILEKRDVLNIYTYDKEEEEWSSTVFKHDSTFETLAIETELKESIVNDIDMFVKRKEYFKSVGRAWKRGYLLYGPPGTGKSSLVAAIANYVRYNIYDLQLQSVKDDASLRRLLTSTSNKSILLIEDIDCSTKASHERSDQSKKNQEKEEENNDESDDGDKLVKPHSSINPGATLSGLLNFIDGLWSSCGDERIIIFTTNHKDKLDEALLRPGRMDVHVYMGHCSPSGFRKLVKTYLKIEDHSLLIFIEDLIRQVQVTPAEVAQQLMLSADPDVALRSLIEFINTKGKNKTSEPKEQQIEGEIKEQQSEVVKKKQQNKFSSMVGKITTRFFICGTQLV